MSVRKIAKTLVAVLDVLDNYLEFQRKVFVRLISSLVEDLPDDTESARELRWSIKDLDEQFEELHKQVTDMIRLAQRVEEIYEEEEEDEETYEEDP